MIPDNSADVGTHSVELCKELFDEFVFMLETEFGEERIKLDRVTNGYFTGTVSLGRPLSFDMKEELISQIKSVFWMIIGKQPEVSSEPSSYSNHTTWRFYVSSDKGPKSASHGQPRLELRFGTSIITFWVLDPSAG